jgi:hypothetical protein
MVMLLVMARPDVPTMEAVVVMVGGVEERVVGEGVREAGKEVVVICRQQSGMLYVKNLVNNHRLSCKFKVAARQWHSCLIWLPAAVHPLHSCLANSR